MKEINYKEMKFNPFNLIGDEWMLVTAGDERLKGSQYSGACRLHPYNGESLHG